MQVFKFGGASVNSIERIRNLAEILCASPGDQKLIVISAMGKTTNALEKVVDAFYHQQMNEAQKLFQAIREEHLHIAQQLIRGYAQTEKKLIDFFTEVEWLLHDQPKREYDYYYDQMVCVGELLSTGIVSDYLNENGVSNLWFDVRDVFRTDDNYRDANIDWSFTQSRINELIVPQFREHGCMLTQGFIGSTAENESTTLGREGSDYSAAVFANLLSAESQTIWKDVSGVMNADPKEFPDAQLIADLNYDEVIEMAYYGAQVIHPKTIKPLQNKSIPLYVKCFLDPKLPGTIIHNGDIRGLPAIIVRKRNQVLMHLHSKDFSFVGERPTGELYHIFAELNIKPNLMQSGAVTLQVCLDDRSDKIEKLALKASEFFDVHAEKGLVLLTIRHHDPKTVEGLSRGKKIVLRQESPETVQLLMREN